MNYKKNMPTISFKPKKVTKRITSQLQDRASDVIMSRFGLTADGKRKTLEEIGKKYNITRERVRQIEDAALGSIKKSDVYRTEQAIFDELKQVIRKLGSIVAEHELLPHISKDKITQNHIHFFLTLGDSFKRHREDEHFHTRWSVDDEMTARVHDSLKKLYASLDSAKIFDGKDVSVLVSGRQLANALLAISTLKKNKINCRLLSFHTVKPLDRLAIIKAAKETRGIVVVEEHFKHGGLGTAVAEILIQEGLSVPFVGLGVDDEFPNGSGSQDYFLKKYGLSPDGIIKAVKNILSRKQNDKKIQ